LGCDGRELSTGIRSVDQILVAQNTRADPAGNCGEPLIGLDNGFATGIVSSYDASTFIASRISAAFTEETCGPIRRPKLVESYMVGPRRPLARSKIRPDETVSFTDRIGSGIPLIFA
jgi:hypothetical protein